MEFRPLHIAILAALASIAQCTPVAGGPILCLLKPCAQSLITYGFDNAYTQCSSFLAASETPVVITETTTDTTTITANAAVQTVVVTITTTNVATTTEIATQQTPRTITETPIVTQDTTIISTTVHTQTVTVTDSVTDTITKPVTKTVATVTVTSSDGGQTLKKRKVNGCKTRTPRTMTPSASSLMALSTSAQSESGLSITSTPQAVSSTATPVSDTPASIAVTTPFTSASTLTCSSADTLAACNCIGVFTVSSDQVTVTERVLETAIATPAAVILSQNATMTTQSTTTITETTTLESIVTVFATQTEVRPVTVVDNTETTETAHATITVATVTQDSTVAVTATTTVAAQFSRTCPIVINMDLMQNGAPSFQGQYLLMQLDQVVVTALPTVSFYLEAGTGYLKTGNSYILASYLEPFQSGPADSSPYSKVICTADATYKLQCTSKATGEPIRFGGLIGANMLFWIEQGTTTKAYFDLYFSCSP